MGARAKAPEAHAIFRLAVHYAPPMTRAFALVTAAIACTWVACGDAGAGTDAANDNPGAGSCLDRLPRGPDECDLQFAPTYDAFYENLLGTTCGGSSTGSSCHGPEGGVNAAGLFLGDHDKARAYLLGEVDGRVRVVPGDPECSILVQRIESKDPDFQMPRGGMLSPEQRCSIVTWVAMGAEP